MLVFPPCHSSHGYTSACVRDECGFKENCKRYRNKEAMFRFDYTRDSGRYPSPIRKEVRQELQRIQVIPAEDGSGPARTPVKCSDCSIWDECPALTLRMRGHGCSFFKPWELVDYFSFPLAEDTNLPVKMVSASEKLLGQVQALFDEKDKKIAELVEKLEGAEHCQDDLRRQLQEAEERLSSLRSDLSILADRLDPPEPASEVDDD